MNEVNYKFLTHLNFVFAKFGRVEVISKLATLVKKN